MSSHLIVLSCLPDHVPGESHNTKWCLIVEGHFSGVTLIKFLSVTLKSQELQLEELVGMFDAAKGVDHVGGCPGPGARMCSSTWISAGARLLSHDSGPENATYLDPLLTAYILKSWKPDALLVSPVFVMISCWKASVGMQRLCSFGRRCIMDGFVCAHVFVWVLLFIQFILFHRQSRSSCAAAPQRVQASVWWNSS